MPTSAFPRRVASSYCTDREGCATIGQNTGSLNAVSATTYYIASTGELSACSDSYGACNFSHVREFNAEILANTSAVIQPLVFSNSGNMVQAFRALMKRGVQIAADFLMEEAITYGYQRVQLDLEPSCWDANASQCQWPTAEDARSYVRLVNATADALSKVGADCSIAVGNYPLSQCTVQQYDQCSAAGDVLYAAYCTSGAWTVDVCNCCAYLYFYALSDLCASRAAKIVNMDTYQSRPTNISLFYASIDWYTSHGCTVDRLSIGLLTNQANCTEEVTTLLDAVRGRGISAVDLWANLWGQPELLDAWLSPLESFLNAREDDDDDSYGLDIIGAGVALAVLLLAVLLLGMCCRQATATSQHDWSTATRAVLLKAPNHKSDSRRGWLVTICISSLRHVAQITGYASPRST